MALFSHSSLAYSGFNKGFSKENTNSLTYRYYLNSPPNRVKEFSILAADLKST